MDFFRRCGVLLATVFLLFSSCKAELVEHSWNIQWVSANPDDRQARPVVSVNGQFPGPTLRVRLGDTLRVHVYNGLQNETTSIHWHGIHQTGTNVMDGAIGVTQCGINPGQNMTYEFKIQQTGTYWWHSHAPGQYTDGLRGPLIIEDPKTPFHYDEEAVLTLTDWYHDEMPNMLPTYLSPKKNPDGAEPEPYSLLLNEASTTSFQMQAGKTYYFRVINMAAFAMIYLNLEGHEMTIIEVDGTYTEPQTVDSIYVAVAQRYGVLVKAKEKPVKNYAILASMNKNAFDSVPKYVRDNATGQLTYDTSKAPSKGYTLNSWDVMDDMDLIPYDRMPLLDGTPDQTIMMDLNFSTIAGQNRASWNGRTYVAQTVPSIITAMTGGAHSSNAEIFGEHTNPHILGHNNLIEIIINNYDDGPHPIHIHGHQPQIVEKRYNVFNSKDPEKRDSASSFSARWRTRDVEARDADDGSTSNMRPFPIRRDVWTLAPSGQTKIRFIADNPGVWFFHCHMEWHVEAGLAAIMIEAPEEMQKTQSIDSMLPLCVGQGVPTSGNAVGNSQDLTNCTGQLTVPPINHGAVVSSPGYGAN